MRYYRYLIGLVPPILSQEIIAENIDVGLAMLLYVLICDNIAMSAIMSFIVLMLSPTYWRHIGNITADYVAEITTEKQYYKFCLMLFHLR